MLKRLTATFFCFWVMIAAAFGQINKIDDFGHVPDSLFAANQYPSNPEVPFIYSLKKLHIHFDEDQSSIIAVLHYHVRVKIFDSSVKEAAVVGIPYYFENKIEQISGIHGFTYQNPNTKVALDTTNIRTININSRYNVKEFTMPAVKDGSVIEYEYTIRRRYIEELPDFYLANQVPTERSEVSITYPRYLRYQGIVQNFNGNVDHFFTRTDTSTAPKVFTFPQPAPVVQETWRAFNIPAVQKEAYISTLDDYRGKVKFQLSEFGIPRQTLENSWKFVVAEIRRKQQVNARIRSDEYSQKIGKQIARNFEDKKAAQDSIFQFVNQNTRYSGSKAPFNSDSDSLVLQGNPSDQAAINQALAAMLQGAGIEAYPVLISSRESGRINRSFPSFFQFNGQLVYSEIDGQPYFMDASYAYSQPNLIPVDMYNETGLLLKPKNYRWVDINPSASAFSIKVNIKGKLDRRGNLSGTLNAANKGYPARQIRKQHAEGQGTAQIIQKALFDGYSDARITNARLQKNSDGITVSGDFNIKNYATSFTDGLEFRPMIVGYLRQNPFDSEHRSLPVTLDAPEHLDLTYNISLPRGISIDEIPQQKSIHLPGAMLTEHYNGDQNTLRYNFKIDISRKQFSPDLFPRLLNLYNQWVDLSKRKWHLGR